MRISDWSSDVCSSDLPARPGHARLLDHDGRPDRRRRGSDRVVQRGGERLMAVDVCECAANWRIELVLLTTGEVLKVIIPTQFEFEMVYLEAGRGSISFNRPGVEPFAGRTDPAYVKMLQMRSYAHTSELQSLMRIPHAVL